MKSVRDFIAQDMWGHILMSGPDVKGCATGTMYQTAQEKLKYCQGIFVTYPHMMLANFSRWLWEENSPKEYAAFMEPSIQALQSRVFPVLEEAFAEGTTLARRGELLIPLLTDVIPTHVLTGYYDYMFAGQKDYKDISEFWPTVAPVLSLTGRMLQEVYTGALSQEEIAEAYLFVGTRYPYLLVKRLYDWQYGVEKMEMPPPPPGQ